MAEEDYIQRPEFNSLRDHVDEQHVKLFQHVTDSEVSMLGKLTASSRWMIGTFLTIFLATASFYFSTINEVDAELSHQIARNANKVEKQDELIHRSIEQSLSNSLEIQNTANLLGASIQNSGITNQALIDKVQLIQENTQMQINDIKQRLQRNISE